MDSEHTIDYTTTEGVKVRFLVLTEPEAEVNGTAGIGLGDSNAIISYPGDSVYTITIPAQITDDTGTFDVVSVNERAFSGVRSSTVILPNSIVSIGDYAFSESAHLTSLNIPASVSTIGKKVFMGSASLERIDVDSDSTGFRSEDGVLFDKDGMLLAYPTARIGTAYVMPNFSRGIDEYAFAYSTLSSIDISNSVQWIGESAFWYCSNIVSLDIPNDVILGDGALAGMTGIREFTISDSNSRYTLSDGAIFNKGKTVLIKYPGQRLGTEYTVPSTVKELSQGAFDFNNNLQSITLPSGLEKIGASAFMGCTVLTSVEIPASVTAIGAYTFSGCTALESVTIGANITSFLTHMFSDCSSLRELTYPAGVTEICDYAFSNSGLRSFEITDDVVRIGSYAFYNCTNLTAVTVGESLENIGPYAFASSGIRGFRANENLIKISDHAFNNCRGLRTFIFNEELEEIGEYAFTGSAVDSVTINNKLKSLGASAFADCDGLTAVNIVGNSLSISQGAFSGCDMLTNAVIGNGVNIIGVEAFSGCVSLTTVDIGVNVLSIRDRAFGSCVSLKSVNILSGTVSFGVNVFGDCVFYDDDGETVLDLEDLPGHAYYGQSYIKLIRQDGEIVTVYYDTNMGSGEVPSDTVAAGDYILATYDGTRTDCKFVGWTDGKSIYEAGQTVNISTSTTFYAVWERTDVMFVSETVDEHLILYYKVIREPAGDMHGSLELSGNSSDGKIKGVTKIVLTSQTIPISQSVNGCYDIERIGNSAFINNRNVDVMLPDTVVSIGAQAFFGCTGQTYVYLGGSVNYIGDKAFVGCTSIEEFYVSPSNPFMTSDSGIVYSKDMRKVIYYPAASPATYYNIPETVTSVNSYAFYGSINLQTILIPDTVADVGDYAFSYSGLTSINIPDNTVISVNSLRFCSELTNIVLGLDNERYISENGVMFDKLRWTIICYPANKSDTVYTIPTSVRYIEDYAFYGCRNLETINFDTKGVKEEDPTTPSAVIRIGERAFANCLLLDSVVLPSSLTEVKAGAFEDCAVLSNIIFSSDIKVDTIPDYMFSGCSNLSSILYPSTVRYIKAYAFNECVSLEVIDINNSVESLGDYSFYGCTDLKTVRIDGDHLYHVGANVFAGCSSLNGINLPDTVQTIGKSAFEDCTSLMMIGLPASLTAVSESTFKGCTALTVVSFSGDVDSIGDQAFYGCRNIAVFNIPDSVDSIGSEVFAYCISLTSAEIPNSVRTLGNRVFYGCIQLSNYTIPESVNTIGVNTFEDCIGLSTVYFMASVSELPACTFIGCTKLASLKLSQMINKLGPNAFSGCISLTTLPVPGTVTIISEETFFGCNGLTEISIPNSITDIGDRAFGSCTGLKTVNLPSSVIKFGESIFEGCTNLTTAYFSGLAKLGESMFKGCTSLDNVYVSSNVKDIGDGAFRDCTGLKTITISEGVSTIGEASFSGCTGLIYLTIPNSVTSVGMRAFENCTSLETLRLSSSMSSLNQYIFSGCSNLKSVTIPSSVTSLKDYAFYSCPSLKSITVPSSVTGISELCFDSDVEFRNNNTVIPLNQLPGYTYTERNGNRILYRQDTKMTYTLTYVDESTTLFQSEHAAGEMVTMHDLPVIEGRVVEWRTEFTIVNNQIMMPSFDLQVNLATAYVTYRLLLYDGNSVWVDMYIKDGEPLPEIETPAKPSTAQYSYTFECWVDSDGKTVVLPQTMTYSITAWSKYTVMVNKYTLTLYDEDRVTIFYSYTLDYGSEVPKIKDPVKEKTAEATYRFIEWVDENGVKAVIPGVLFSDFTAYAKFEKTINNYLIKYIDSDLTTVLYEDILPYGTQMPILPDREKPSTPQYTYNFVGWANDKGTIIIPTPTVVGEMVVHAVFSQVVNQYIIVYYVDIGVPAGSFIMEYGTVIVPIEGPAKESDGSYTYTFRSWSGYTEGMTVTKNESFFAEYDRKIIIPESGDAKIDSKNEKSALVDESTVNDLKEKAQTAGNITLTIIVKEGDAVFDNSAILTLTGNNSLSMQKVSEKSQKVKELVGDSPVYEIDFGNNKNFGDGIVTISLRYDLPQGKDPSKLAVYCIVDEALSEKKECSYENGEVSFDTDHFSTFAIVLESEKQGQGVDMTWVIVGAVAVIAVLLAGVIIIRKRRAK